MSAITMTVPMPPNVANARQHWRVKHNSKQEYWGKLNVLQASGLLPKPPYPTPHRSLIHARMFLGAPMDHDNALARMKFLLDWLRAERYIFDDSPKCLEWQGFPEQIIKRDGNYRVELSLTPL